MDIVCKVPVARASMRLTNHINLIYKVRNYSVTDIYKYKGGIKLAHKL